jgi:MFS family permease
MPGAPPFRSRAPDIATFDLPPLLKVMSTGPASRRTVLMLAVCQALAMTGTSIVSTTASIIGSMLAPDRALSTLPIAVQMTGMMMATIPAALLMARIGRRPGFWIGAGVGATGAGIAATAVFHADFVLFCVGTFMLGTYNGTAQQYRFAASEIADEGFRPKARWCWPAGSSRRCSGRRPRNGRASCSPRCCLPAAMW